MREAMNSEERLMAAVHLKPYDRPPVVPIISQFAMKQNREMSKGREADPWWIVEALRKNFDDLGGYDGKITAGYNWPFSSWRQNSPLGKSVNPGERGISQDFSTQYEELEIMTVQDYDTIIAKGWNKFCEQYFPRVSGLSLEQIEQSNRQAFDIWMEDAKYWRSRKIPIIAGALIVSCEMTLSLGRTFPQFTMDLHRMPDKVQAALEAMVPDFIENVLRDTQATGVPWVHISLERGSAAYYSLKTFERFFFPQLKKIVETLTANGIYCWLHMDTNWTKNLPYLRDIPKGKCICNTDSITDIFKAKEILGDHMCLMGDVPPSLQSLGTKAEVEAYCEKLIRLVGKGGGYIMCSGCEVPIDARFENVKAMIDSVKNYPYPRSK